MRSRNEVVNLINSWIGLNERDGTHRKIINIYNSYGKENLPRKILMQYNWAWCACTWSALAIKLGYADIMPLEISCGYLIAEARKLNIWKENDNYVPKPGDAVLYDWDDSGKGDNVGWPDHVGTVVYSNEEAGYFVVVEGNYDDSVKKRTVDINGRYIRGFITPNYDTIEEGPPVFEQLPGKSINEVAHEVIAGVWGDGKKREIALTNMGYNYLDVQNRVNSILNDVAYIPDEPQDQNQPFIKQIHATCYAQCYNRDQFTNTYKTKERLYCRNGAGTNKKALCVIPKDTEVKCWGFYSTFNGVKWLLVEVILNGVLYTGFCSEKYLEEV